MTSWLTGLEPIAASFVAALPNVLWQGVVLFAMVWLALHTIRIVNATTRYAIWLACLISIGFLPLINLAVPFEDTEKHEPRVENESTRSKELESTADPILIVRPREVTGSEHLETKPLAAGLLLPKRVGAYEVVSLDDTRETARLFPFRISPGRWPAFLFLGWLVGVVLMLSRVAWSYRFLNRLKKKSTPIPLRLDKRLEHWNGLSRSKRSIALRCSNEILGPVAAGLTRPVILLPCHLVKELSEQELDQVGLHEMAHICRRDDWTNLLQKIMEAVFFFHPAIHWIGGQLDAEREIACDDWVIYRTRQPKSYAACLTRLIELTGRVKAPALAPGGFTTKKQIARRIEMSLKQSHQTKPRISKLTFLVGILLLMFIGVQFAKTLPLVAIQEEKVAASKVEETPKAEMPSEESASVVGEKSSLDEEQESDPKKIKQAEKEIEAKLRAEAEEREAIEQQRAMDKEIEEKVRAEAEERKQLRAMREREAIDQRRALHAELAALEGKEHLYREMLSQTEEQVGALEALELAETPEAVFLSEAGVVPFGLLETRKASLPEEELIALMVEIASNDPDNEVRMAAIRSIGRLGSKAASEALISIYDSQDDTGLKKTILSSLGWSRDSSARVLEKLENIASSEPNPELRKAALQGLAGLPGDGGVSALISIYGHTEERDLKKVIIRYLSRGRSEEALAKLKDIARSDTDASLRLEAVQSLGGIHRGTEIGYAEAPVFARPYLSAMPVPAPDPPVPPKPPAPPKKK